MIRLPGLYNRRRARAAEEPRATPGGLVDRRRKVRTWWEGGRETAQAPDDVVGLALSGGGIRSATFSLGVIEALAKSRRDALSKIDILSTVSGGGYIGCFLRSLFMPNEGRGMVPEAGDPSPTGDVVLDKAAIADQYEFARHVLKSGANEQDLSWPQRNGKLRRNPLWWLREHSRYLAPNGPTDYAYAVAYIARNWVAMQYIFLLGSLALFSLLVLAEAFLAWLGVPLGWTWIPVGAATGPAPCGADGGCEGRWLAFSPVFAITAIPIFLCMLLSIAYWMTERMSANDPDTRRQARTLLFTVLITIAGAALILVLAVGFATWIHPALAQPTWSSWTAELTGSLFAVLLTGGMAMMTFAAVAALAVARKPLHQKTGFVSELRRHLTQNLSTCIMAIGTIVAIAIVDSLGALLAVWFRTPHRFTAGALAASVLPVLAYVIKKLPDWFGGPDKGALFSLLQRFVSTLALIAGLILFGAVAVISAGLMHLAAWHGSAWQPLVDWPRLSVSIVLILVLTVLSGTSTGFINLSSLHLFYASRLTRAYLGASNNRRLEDAAKLGPGSSIRENHPGDYIQPEVYSRADLPGPIHIINSTINETIDPHSQIVARDRKGDVISVEPNGIRVRRNQLVHWNEIDVPKAPAPRRPGEESDDGSWSEAPNERQAPVNEESPPKLAEQMSLGQWCAISGAAASSGMGRLTTLGFALAFTFANIRLGYWWCSPGVRPDDEPDQVPTSSRWNLIGTFIYLFNEMTARYSLAYDRKYLTDGGHFENTGAYRLIEARVPLILVCDNGADPQYRFQDLENLVRTVRLDFGYEIELLGGEALREFASKYGAQDTSIFADQNVPGDWRLAFTAPEQEAFVLALKVHAVGKDLDLFWIKPKLQKGVPADILGYAAENAPFPQQPTGDQFFDEAQWESYRALGEFSMARLLTACPKLLAKAPASKPSAHKPKIKSRKQ